MTQKQYHNITTTQLKKTQTTSSIRKAMAKMVAATTSKIYSIIIIMSMSGRLTLATRLPLAFSTAGTGTGTGTGTRIARRNLAAAFVAPRTRQRQHQHTSSSSVLFISRRRNDDEADDDNDNDNNTSKPTWTYEPYNPNNRNNNINRQRLLPPPQRRNFSTPSAWTVPKTVAIKEDELDISFVRSSGAGGQNVNKLSTKCEIRMDTNKSSSSWLPDEVRRRLIEQQKNRISKDGILTLNCQENRTQGMNKKTALDKLQNMIKEAWVRPKIRNQRTGVTKATKRRNKEFKKARSETKNSRKRVDW
jgi:hypothetical protein